jgi:Apea-like HEPN
MMRREPRDPQLWKLTKAAVIEAKRLLDDLMKRTTYIGEYFDYPSLTRLDNGFPSVRHQPFGKLPDYTDAFGLRASSNAKLPAPYFAFEDIQSFVKVIDYVLSHEDLRAYMGPPQPHPTDRKSTVLASGLFITEILNRYLHLHGTEGEVEEERLLPIYLEMEAPPLEEELPAEILVPIVLTGFDVKEPMDLSPGTRIEKLSDPDHLARVPHRPVGSAVNGLVLSASTHALVLTGKKIRLESRWSWPYQELGFYPLGEIERFFEALRLVTGYDTGYAQVVIRPLGWAIDYTGSLPPLIPGPTIRQYPEHFDNYGWIGERPSVSKEQVKRTGEVVTALLTSGRRIALAARRLSSSKLRVREDDRIIDLCIALEALLGDKSPTETTHKLAMRVAAIHAQSDTPKLPPPEVFASVKRIYDYRSSVAHGEDPEKKRLIPSLAAFPEPISTTYLAEYYVRIVLLTLLRKPAWRDPATIDRQILLGSLSPMPDET